MNAYLLTIDHFDNLYKRSTIWYVYLLAHTAEDALTFARVNHHAPGEYCGDTRTIAKIVACSDYIKSNLEKKPGVRIGVLFQSDERGTLCICRGTLNDYCTAPVHTL